MADFIDRAAVLTEIYQYTRHYWPTVSYVESIIQKQPAADAVPVRHGRWEMRPTGMETDTGPEYKAYCTVCNEPNKQYQPPYCPHCGAKMGLEGETNDD